MTYRSRHHFRTLRTLGTLIVLLFAMIPAYGLASAHQPESDQDLVERTVLELSRLQQRGNGDELYDWLSEMSRERVSREAFVAWTSSSAAFAPTEDPEIRDIDFASWEWPVTGMTYPDVATVEVIQRGTRAGVTLRETSTYLLLFDGWRWRWLFGESEAELNEIANQPVPALAFASTFEDETYAMIDRFWARVFADLDLPYRPVEDIVAVGSAPLETGCGTESDIDRAGIYMCLLDETIYYSPALRTNVIDRYGEAGWQTIIAHEWSHHIQAQLGIDYSLEPELDGGHYILELESQADCLAGLYTQDLASRDLVSNQDLQLVRRVLGAYGDLGPTNWDAVEAHGTGAQRVEAFNIGFHSGFIGCGLDLDAYAA